LCICQHRTTSDSTWRHRAGFLIAESARHLSHRSLKMSAPNFHSWFLAVDKLRELEEQSFRTWATAMKDAYASSGAKPETLPDARLIAIALGRTGGLVREQIKSFPQTATDSYDHLVAELEKQCCNTKATDRSLILQQLKTLDLQKGIKSLVTQTDQLRVRAMELNFALPDEEFTLAMLSALAKGHPDLSNFIEISNDTSDFLQIRGAILRLASHRQFLASSSSSSSSPLPGSSIPHSTSTDGDILAAIQRLSKEVKEVKNRTTNYNPNFKRGKFQQHSQQDKKRPPPAPCPRCGANHWLSDCRLPKDIQCRKCGIKGHIARSPKCSSKTKDSNTRLAGATYEPSF